MLFMEQFQQDVVLCQVDANVAEWGRNTAGHS